MDELIWAEQVFTSEWMTELKPCLQLPHADQIMETLVLYKKERLLVDKVWDDYYSIPKNYAPKDQYKADVEASELIRLHTGRRDQFWRELRVLVEGEERVRQSELQEEQTWKEFADAYAEIEASYEF